MTGRTITVQLTDDQAGLLDQLAADRESTPDALLLDAIAHGLAMIAAGVDETDLREPWDHPNAHDPNRHLPDPADPGPGYDLPF